MNKTEILEKLETLKHVQNHQTCNVTFTIDQVVELIKQIDVDHDQYVSILKLKNSIEKLKWYDVIEHDSVNYELTFDNKIQIDFFNVDHYHLLKFLEKDMEIVIF